MTKKIATLAVLFSLLYPWLGRAGTVTKAAAPLVIDGQSEGRIFEGLGAVSAGASSRLLIDYPEPQRSQVLDYLFKPHYGAALQHLKVEIGGDVNSTDGTEPSHLRAKEGENYQRGYEWWLMKEAKRRNPKVILDALEWGAPAWLGTFYSQHNADYIVKFIQGAKREHGLDIDCVGIWNETPYDVAWIKLLRRTLNAAGLHRVRIVAADSNNDGSQNLHPWDIVGSARKDPELAEAIFAFGAHYPEYKSRPEALATGKPLWSSEDGPWRGDWEGARKLAQTFNRNYVLGRITKTEIWSPVSSYYDNLPLPGSGLMRASEPWSAHYEPQPALWAVAHTTQFARPGWRYLDSACVLIQGGSVVALKSPDGADCSVVIETMEAEEPQTLTFKMANLVAKKLHVWRTDKQQHFVQEKDLAVNNGLAALRAEPRALYTLTTTRGQAKGRSESPPSKPFPLPYREDFEGYAPGATPRYLSDQGGAFEIVKRADGKGQALRQVVTQKGIEWHYHLTPDPETFIGGLDWTNYEVSVKALAENSGFVSLFGRVGKIPSNSTPPEGYWLKVGTRGEWELMAVTNSATGTALIGSGRTDFAVGAWHQLTLRFCGTRISVIIDGKLLAEVQDAAFQAGMVGLGSGWHGAQFDELLVQSLQAEASRVGGEAPATNILAGLRPEHPRLLLTAPDWEGFRSDGKRSPAVSALVAKAEQKARRMLKEPPAVYKKEGQRLSALSRAAMSRVELLSFVYRLTGDKAFLKRAEKEMLTVAAFQDWNPTCFLDTAEMTASMALGYDWLYDHLSAKTRATVRQAMVQKGLLPGLDPHFSSWWQSVAHNWNQVCFGGLTLGALAIADEEPRTAAALLQLARQRNSNGLKPYAPDGVYPEGPSYWNYGTGYEILMISALETALGTDWGLSAMPGFLSSAAAQMELCGPTSRPFNFSDGSSEPLFEPWQFWYAQKLQQPWLVYFQAQRLKSWLEAESADDRVLPWLAKWTGGLPANIPVPDLPLAWHAEGPNPVGVFRSSWTDTNALYLAFKGGQASNNHGHMDGGSFVLDAQGIRWAWDLGGQDYFSIESKGWSLWGMGQSSDRWRVFRLNNFSHNTLTLDGKLHNVGGRAEITAFTTNEATVDLTALFRPQASSVLRHFHYAGDKVVIRDEINGAAAGLPVRWQMVTRAAIEIQNDGAVLRQDGRTLRVRLLSAPAGTHCEAASAQPPADGVNQPNPGFTLLALNTSVPASGSLLIEIELQPSSL